MNNRATSGGAPIVSFEPRGWARVLLVPLAVALALWAPLRATAACLSPPGDVNGDAAASVTDVQCVILAVLWSLDGQVDAPPTCVSSSVSPSVLFDHNCDAVVSVADVQLAVSFALGQPLSPIIDALQDGCVDACESDLDGDGDTDLTDCAPQLAEVHAGAAELCNGYDDDCDGQVDELGEPTTQASCSDGSLCTGTESCAATAQPSGVVVSEIMRSAAGGVEWIELYNGALTPRNLRGWRLTNGQGVSHTIDPGGALFIPARGHLTLANNGDFFGNGGVRVGYVYSTYSLGIGAGNLILRDANGAVVDSVATGAPGFPSVANAAAARVSPALASASLASWVLSTEPYGVGLFGTPGGPNRDVAPSPCVPGIPLNCADGAACTVDSCAPASGCVFTPIAPCCGNGVVEPGEACDGSNLGNNTCQSLGFSGGNLGCTPTCGLGTSGCIQSTCDPVSPPFYSLAAPLSFTCVDLFFGSPVVSFNVSGFQFTKTAGGLLRATPAGGSFSAPQGPLPTCPGGSFSLSSIELGGCCERYTLQGTYSSANTWSGVFAVSFCQSPACGCPTGDGFSCSLSTCTSKSWAVQGTR